MRNLAKRGLLRSVSNLSLWREEREREKERQRQRETYTQREERKEGERKGLGTMATTPLPYN